MMNKMEIMVYINSIKQDILKASPDKKVRRELKDKLVYRLMFDKLRSDDNGETDAILNKSEK